MLALGVGMRLKDTIKNAQASVGGCLIIRVFSIPGIFVAKA